MIRGIYLHLEGRTVPRAVKHAEEQLESVYFFLRKRLEKEHEVEVEIRYFDPSKMEIVPKEDWFKPKKRAPRRPKPKT